MHSVLKNSSLRRNGVDTSITLDAAKWNGAGGDIYSIGSCIIIFGTLLEQISQSTFYPFLFYVLIYICLCFLCIVNCMPSFHATHIFIVCINVICTNSFNI